MAIKGNRRIAGKITTAILNSKSSICAHMCVPGLFCWAILLVSCGKDAPEVVAPSPGEWTVVSNLKYSQTMERSRIAHSTCFQMQSLNGVNRLAASKAACPEDPTQPVLENSIVFTLLPKEKNGAVYLSRDGIAVGMAVPILEKEGAIAPRPILDGPLRLQHLCQFSDPSEKMNPYFLRVCKVSFDATGSLGEVVLASTETIVSIYADDQKGLADLASRLTAERKGLEEQMQRLKDKIRLLEGHAETDEFLRGLEQQMDALRTALKLRGDATPEQIGAAVARQGVLSSQFSRELTELKKVLDLPNNSQFEDVIKALRAIKAKRDGEAADPVGDRKEPAASKSPIN